MKPLTLVILLASLIGLIGCTSSHFGKRYEVKKYAGLTGDITEEFYSIHASVAADPKESSSAQLQTTRGRNISITWNTNLPPLSSLDPAKIYQFDLIVTKGKKPRFTTATLYRIKDADHIIADLSLCPMHQRSMHREEEEWIDGSTLSHKGRVTRYPHSGIFHAVCSSGIHHVIWVCPDCRNAEQKQIDRLDGVR